MFDELTEEESFKLSQALFGNLADEHLAALDAKLMRGFLRAERIARNETVFGPNKPVPEWVSELAIDSDEVSEIRWRREWAKVRRPLGSNAR